MESTSDGLRDLPSIAISLCGGLSDNREITKGTGRRGAGPPAGSSLLWQLLEMSGGWASLVPKSFCLACGSRWHRWLTACAQMLLTCWLASGLLVPTWLRQQEGYWGPLLLGDFAEHGVCPLAPCLSCRGVFQSLSVLGKSMLLNVPRHCGVSGLSELV